MRGKTADVEKIRQYYNNGAEHEWDRHDRHRFEFPVTMRYLRKYLPPSSKILDVGGGPGRYSIELTKLGHKLTLFDLAEENVRLAKKMADEQGIRLSRTCVGDARDLSVFKDNSFDAILVFGPLYHLNREEDRKKVIEEALRVLKPGGILAGAFISHYAPLFDTARRFGNTITRERENLLGFLDHGTHIMSEEEPGFVDAYFTDPMEITPFFDSFGLEKLTLFGAESFIAQSEQKLIDLGEELLSQWIDFAYETAETPGAIYGSDHIVYMGRKG